MPLTPMRGAVSYDAGSSLPANAKNGANQLNCDISKLWDAAVLKPVMSGTGDAMVGTATPAVPALTDGMTFWVCPPGSNTGADPTYQNFGTAAKVIKNRKGDALAAGAYDSDGYYPIQYDSANDFFRLLLDENEIRALTPALPKQYLAGFGIANNGTDVNNDLDISAGVGRDAADSVNIVGSALTKRFDAVWAAGNNNGGVLQSANLTGTCTVTNATATVTGISSTFLADFAVGDFFTTAGGQCRRITAVAANSGAAAITVESNWSSTETGVTYKRGGKARNSKINIFAIYKDSDATVDYASAALSVPQDLPSGYSKYRRIGRFLTDSSANNRPVTQDGNYTWLKTPVSDLSTTVSTAVSGATTKVSTAPPGTVAIYEIIATVNYWPVGAVASSKLGVREFDGAASQYRFPVSVTQVTLTDSATNTVAAPVGPMGSPNVLISLNSVSQFIYEIVNASGGSFPNVTFDMRLLGWIDRRDRD